MVRGIGDERLAAALVANLGEIVAGRSDLRRGAELMQEGVRISRLGETYNLSCGILSFAEILVRADQPRAMRLLGPISALREQTGLRHHDPTNTDQMKPAAIRGRRRARSDSRGRRLGGGIAAHHRQRRSGSGDDTAVRLRRGDPPARERPSSNGWHRLGRWLR